MTVVGQCSFLGSSRQTYLNEEEFFTLEKELMFAHNCACPNENVSCDSFQKMCTKKRLVYYHYLQTIKKKIKLLRNYGVTINGEIHKLISFHVPRSSEKIQEKCLVYSRILKFHKVISSFNLHLVKID